MVLMISTDADAIRNVREGLSIPGWKVISVQNESDAFESLDDCSADFLILDLDTPGLRPASVIAAAKQIKPGLRVIALSGRSKMEDAEAVEKGVFYYTTKPVGSELADLLKSTFTGRKREMRLNEGGMK